MNEWAEQVRQPKMCERVRNDSEMARGDSNAKPYPILLTDAVAGVIGGGQGRQVGTSKRGSSIELNHIGTERISAFHQSSSLQYCLADHCIRSRKVPFAAVCELQSVFRKLTKSCFCWSVKPMLKRWS
jgi:hypothetical protein